MLQTGRDYQVLGTIDVRGGSANDQPLNDAREIQARLAHDLDLVLDGGPCGLEPTTVVDLTGEVPALVRRGPPKASPTA